jgi:acyl-CoA thioesterase FadM
MLASAMSLLLRLLVVAIRALLAPGLPPGGESVLRFRVLPTDLDLNGHMNNGRFLTLMDLGRVDLLLRSRMHRPAWRRRWRFLLGSAMVRFRRPLGPFATFQLRTRVLCWDERWFVFEQRFERDGDLAALAVARGLVRGPEGTITPTEVLAAIGFPASSPAVPPYVQAWSDADDQAFAAGRQHQAATG